MLNNIKLSKVSQTSTVLTKTEFNSQSLTSLQIAELTGKKHSHVMRDIRKMFESLESQSKFGQTSYEDEQGKINPMYLLDESESLTLASGYNVKMRKSIIDSWLEMKNQEIKPVKPLTNLEILEIAVAEIKAGQLALESEQKAHSQTKEVLEHKNKVVLEHIEDIPFKTIRLKLNEIVRWTNYGDFQARWKRLYHEFLYRYGINLKERADNRKMQVLDYCEKEGLLTKLYKLSLELFEVNYNSNQLVLA